MIKFSVSVEPRIDGLWNWNVIVQVQDRNGRWTTWEPFTGVGPSFPRAFAHAEELAMSLYDKKQQDENVG